MLVSVESLMSRAGWYSVHAGKLSPLDLHGLPPAPSFRALAYGDADYASCVKTPRSVSGIVITVNVSTDVCASRTEPTFLKSTTAAEYFIAIMAADESILVQKIVSNSTKRRSLLPCYLTRLQNVC
jgi:hypothetical protein